LSSGNPQSDLINTDFKYKHKLNTYKHLVPRPYVWQPYLSVFYDQLDDEHVKLFAAIKDSVEHPADAAKYEFLKKLMKDHFTYEEGEFSKIADFDDYITDHKAKHSFLLAKLDAAHVPIDCDFINFVEDWLVQHIMNTDFAYRGKLVHSVPEPYVWDSTFRVFYERLDDEHKVLFDCIRDCEENPSDAAKLSFCKTKLRMHFDYEEHEFCNTPDYNCYGHYLKHYNFQTKFQAAHLPLSPEITSFAKNWLAQHIKNTDFGYRGKLSLRRFYDVPEPFVWDESFLVEIKQLDDEHVALFDSLRDVEAARDSKETWDKMIDVYKAHFAYEESQFTTILDPDYDPADHKIRHDNIMNTLAQELACSTYQEHRFQVQGTHA
jgi:hemerythrin family non-heme iron protein